MERKLVFVLAGAFAFAAVAGSAMAAGIPASGDQSCSDQIQNNTLKYVNAVQKQVRLSIKNNLAGKASKCSGGFACAGGANNGKTCVDNTGCPSGQCTVNSAKGIAGAINKAKGSLRSKIAQFCTAGSLTNLGFPNSRCPNATTPATLGDCILLGAIGDIGTSVFGDPAGEIMARGATDIVPQATNPLSVCGVTLGSILSIGSASAPQAPAEAGGAAPLLITSCAGTLCQTKGTGAIGNNLTAPTQTFAGMIPVCLVTTTGDAGNSTPESGNIDLGSGVQNSFTPISTTVLIGTTCPICDPALKQCDSGPNATKACSNFGSQDTACPPTVVGTPPVIPNPLNLSTEPVTLSVPANNPGGGATNPSGTFCGNCDLDTTIGCNNDSVCVAASACSGAVGSGCCNFGTNTGAFGVASATSISTSGARRGPYVPIIATTFCTGQSGDGLVDSTQGLPGPVRLVQEQLNAFLY